MNEQVSSENMTYPTILFKLKNDYYGINCKNVASIMQLPEYERLPKAPENVIGIFRFRERVIPIISLRSLFGLPTAKEEAADFAKMLDKRKDDHINWVKELNRAVNTNEPFTLATDPHKCAFGRWYDQYEPESQTIKFHLKKIEEPHRMLHESALKAKGCSQNHDSCGLDECVKSALTDAEHVYMPQIIELLDEAKDIFANHRHSLLIVIETDTDAFALTVDEVLSVEDLVDVATEEQVEKLKGSRYISEIKKSARSSRLVLMIDDHKLEEISQNCKLEERTL